jgi:hypothetical protein
MVLSDEQKAAMRERMEAVRNAKKSKKEAVAAVVAAPAAPAAPEQPKPKPLPQAKRVPKPIDDAVLEKVMPTAPTAPTAPKLKPLAEPAECTEEADEPVPSATPRVAKIQQARFVAAEPKKEKFAKLVFYKEPNAKQQSKLTKILQEDQSSDEEKPVIVSKVAAANDSMETYQQQHEQKLKRMQAMASKFF